MFVKVFTDREVLSIIRSNGWVLKSQNGSHAKYIKAGRVMVINVKNINRMVWQRLVKTYGINVNI